MSTIRAPSGRDRGDEDDEQLLRNARKRVLERDGRRVRVRERLVGLGDEEREERDDRREPARDDGGRKCSGIAEVAREHEHDAEREQPDLGHEVSDARSRERAAPRLREPRVVGGVRHEGDRDPDDDVGALPDREPALALGVPQRTEVGPVERPPREIDECERHCPDRKAADEPPDESDRPEQREHERAGAEDDRPQPLGAEAEELVGECGRGGGDHEKLEDRPADALRDVDRRREERSSLAERRAHERHARDASVRADQARRGEHEVPDEAADEDRDERVGQRQRGDEYRAGHDHEKRDAEIPPEEPRLDPAEDLKPGRNRLDAPAAFDSVGWRHRGVRLDDAAVIPRYFVVAEATHEIQNPTSEEKLLLLGRRLGLGPDSRVLDIASGRGGPAVLLASEFGCTWHGIEISPDFHAVAVERAEKRGSAIGSPSSWCDAATATHEPESYDAALCLGASFVYGSLADTVEALAPAVRPGGHVVVGEPFWRRLPLPEDYEDRHEPWTSLDGTVRIFETSGIPVVSVIASSEDDWDRYETLHWETVERWLAANPGDADAAEIRNRHERAKWNYLRHQRDYLGWAIFVGRKQP